MLALLSPAKTLDLTSTLTTRKHTGPRFLARSEAIIAAMRTRSAADIAALQGISDELAALNAQRWQEMELPLTPANARPAALTFAGDAYVGLDAARRFDARDWTEAQKTLRLLSGLYGLLRPLDLIQPYRLEMGTPLAVGEARDLYELWADTVPAAVAADLAASPGADVVVNVASTEYATAARLDELDARVLSPRFEDRGPRGDWKVLSLYAKRARGTMAGWLVTERVRTAKGVLEFDQDGYRYARDVSTPDVPVFRRAERPGGQG